jgi:3'-5' exoribonuclease 1
MKTSGKTLYDYLAVIDFEATCDENNPSYRHEIIEFPIVLVDVDKMEIVS